ncbi:MAG TPA: ABC transporter permease, partial [Longimicrobiales bacterium]|nr:ABC transporter permease [Longimicrobiales bacterium]
MLESVRQDAAYGLRALRARPGATLAAVLTLTLGIGATTALVTVVDHVLLRPLVYGDAEDLYSLWGVLPGVDQVQPSHPDFRDWRESARTVELAYAYGDVFALRGDQGAERVMGSAVSAGFFDVMRTPAARGRPFAPEEAAAGSPVVVLSHGYWTRRFGADPALIGRPVVLNGVEHTVVGVMPAGFAWPEWSEIWV